ncbi:rodlin [Streptomyces monomycini]|uniref:rodlin n=2 Tax=Streptomyces monomycini TaxID=371720 RepID=UPI001EEBF890|nr:rodlin [Streptomyces monomycini]
MNKMMASVAVAASLVGISAAAAPQAMAVGDGRNTGTANGNHSAQAFGNGGTEGDMSPDATLIGDSLNKLCIGIPVTNVQNIVALVNIGVQDILSSDQHQQCVENSTESQQDQALSHLIDKLPILSQNGVNNE